MGYMLIAAAAQPFHKRVNGEVDVGLSTINSPPSTPVLLRGGGEVAVELGFGAFLLFSERGEGLVVGFAGR